MVGTSPARNRRAALWPSRVPARRRRTGKTEGPAARLLEKGPRSLGNEDLLELVLGAAGEPGMARDVLRRGGGLNALAQASVATLQQIPELSRGRLVRLAAALELGRRATWVEDGRVPCFQSAADAARFVITHYGNVEVEEFGILMLDARGCLIDSEIISRGSLTGSLVHPRDLFRVAVARQAAGVVVFHNHPSGDINPSDTDRMLTARLREVGDMVGIPVVDHLVIGFGKWHSFAESDPN